MRKESQSCSWPAGNPLMIKYHDEEWGVPLHDDQKLFGFLVLEGFQAGLSWLTVLRKRENFSLAFDNFDFGKVAQYDQRKIDKLMQNEGIIRNKLKIEGTIANAKAFIEVRKTFGTFDKYIWQFIDRKLVDGHRQASKDIPAKTELSDQVSIDLKKRGFKFVGSTIMYAHMQATGMINDHVVTCARYKACKKMR